MKVIHQFRTSGAGYGLERNIVCTLPGLAKAGIEVIAVAVIEPRSGPLAEPFRQQLAAAGVRLIELPCSARVPFRLAQRLSRVFAEERPDIVHSHDYKTDLAMLFAQTHGAARVTTIHGWCSRDRKERFYEWLNIQCCKRMNGVVVFCEDYRRRLVSHGVPERLVHVIPVGLDLSVLPRGNIDFRERWGLPRDAVLVALLGRLSAEKRPGLFIEAARNLAVRYPQARFVLVGDGALRAQQERTVQALGLSKAILFAGYVSEMGDVLGTIDIAVNCSSTEAIPRTILEAGAAGVPVVATAVGGIPDVVQDGVTGILCGADDGKAIERGLARLIEDGDLRRRMGDAARDRVRADFSIAACTKRLVQFYGKFMPVYHYDDKACK